MLNGPKKSWRDAFLTLTSRCAGIQDQWEYRNQAVALSNNLHYKDEHVMTFKEYTDKWQKIFHLYYLAWDTLSEGMKIEWFLDGLKTENGLTVSISMSVMFSVSSYSNDLNKVIARLTMDIAGNIANKRTSNFMKNGGKKLK